MWWFLFLVEAYLLLGVVRVVLRRVRVVVFPCEPGHPSQHLIGQVTLVRCVPLNLLCLFGLVVLLLWRLVLLVFVGLGCAYRRTLGLLDCDTSVLELHYRWVVG